MLEALLDAVLYTGVGLGILLLGFYVLDLATPGRLAQHIGDGSKNAALVASSSFIGLSAVIFTAIWTNADSATDALGWTIAFGIMGVLMQQVGFWAIELLTPGSLRDAVCAPGITTAMGYVAAASQLAVSAIVVASIA